MFYGSNFFTWFNIAGVMPNLFVMLIMVIGLFMKKKSGFIFGIIFGLLIDLFVGVRIGINAIALAVVGLCAEALDKSFSKDNRITVMFLTCILTVLAEVIVYALQILFCGTNLQVLEFTKVIAIEVLYNAILIAVIYPLFWAFGSKIEDDFTNNRLLKF
ncbi:MAG: rod shape-determining protein MreD [Clostridia bacterium]